MKRTTVTKHGLDVNTFNDRWSEKQEELKALAADLASADIAVVNTTRALIQAQKAQAEAVAKKTAAEKRLAKVRANLGGE